MTTTVVLALALLAAVLAGRPGAAEAGGVRIVIGGPPFAGRPHHVVRPHPGRVIVVPRPVYLAPRRCLAPGAWTYQWVPQSQVAYAWVPAHYNTDALWVEGQYVPQVFQSGYWQPIWIEGRWVDC